MRTAKRIPIIILVLMMVVLSSCQQQASIPAGGDPGRTTNQLTREEKLKDFEYMYKILEENYPFFDVNKRATGVDWLANKDSYINMIKGTKTDEEYEAILNLILDDLHNGHALIINKFYYNSLRASFELESASKMTAWKEQLYMPKTVTRYSNMDSSPVRGAAGSDQKRNSASQANISYDELIDGKVAYLRIASMNPSLVEKDGKEIEAFLQGINSFKALILDIRDNGGGDQRYWERNIVSKLITKPISWKTYFVYRGGDFSKPFIDNKLLGRELMPIENIASEKLKNMPPELTSKYRFYIEAERSIEPQNPTGFKGKIYLLVNRNVYSSSEAFASFAKSTGFATLIGEMTGGDGIGQDPLFCSLPESGCLMQFPFVMGLTADGSCNEESKTKPDINVSAEIAADVSKDEAIQYVLKLYK